MFLLGADRIELVLDGARQMKRAHSAGKRGHENGEVTNAHRSSSSVVAAAAAAGLVGGPAAAHHHSYSLQQAPQSGGSVPRILDFTPKMEPHEATVRPVRISTHIPPHHMPIARVQQQAPPPPSQPQQQQNQPQPQPPVSVFNKIVRNIEN